MNVDESDLNDKDVRSSMIFTLLQDQQMEDYFINQHDERLMKKQQELFKQKKYQETEKDEKKMKLILEQQKNKLKQVKQEKYQLKEIRQQKNQLKQVKVDVNAVSRLYLQKQKYNLNFVDVLGESFIHVCEASLFGLKRQEQGLLMVTNYRILFFGFRTNGTNKKRVDLPYGFINNIEYNQKKYQISLHLNYSHFWKFIIGTKQNFQTIKMMNEIYYKPSLIKNSFCFVYAQKSSNFKPFNYQILKQYDRMNLSQISLIFPNNSFTICQTYSPYISLPQIYSESSQNQIKAISYNYINNRLPILSYRYKAAMKQWSGIWISGSLVQQKKININEIKKYLLSMREKNESLSVFQMGVKNVKAIAQSKIAGKTINNYLNLHSSSQTKNSYNLIVQCHLNSKKQFIGQVLASKWYEQIFNLINNSSLIVKRIVQLQHVLIKEIQSFIIAPIISSLVQIIIEPYYRTFKGFRNLIMKEFINFGYPFASKLGQKNPEDQSPGFIQFLDAVSQLIHINPFYFEFNYKYLSKLSNLMYTNIFGTFVCDNPKQFYENLILEQTVQIWQQLQSQLTANAFYQNKFGILQLPKSISSLRLWTEHFSYLTGQPKDIYRIHPAAQTNTDYINLQCLKIKNENASLKGQIEKQIKQIKKLKELKELRQKQQNTKSELKIQYVEQ